MENNQEGSGLKTFIFIGRSGCGKGTQVEQLAEHLKGKGIINSDHAWLRVETGAQFRKFAERDNYSACKLKESMESGNRLPDCFAIWTWCNYFIENYTGEEHIFCDGCPRSLLEAQSLDFLFRFYNRKELSVVYLDISKEEATRRMLARGRADDQLEDIEKRLEWFDKDVVPAIEYYRNNSKYKFVEVDGEQTIEKIHEDLISMLDV